MCRCSDKINGVNRGCWLKTTECSQRDSVGVDGKHDELYWQLKAPRDSCGSTLQRVSSWCLIHGTQLVHPVPASAARPAWPSCLITSSFATPMGSCTHATAPRWAQYGTTYQPIHSPEQRGREAALWNEWRDKVNGMEKNGWAYACGRIEYTCKIWLMIKLSGGRLIEVTINQYTQRKSSSARVLSAG